MVREALAALLGLEPDIEVVAQVARGDEVLAAARAHAVDVALLDIEMPGATGIEAAAELHRALPDLKLVVLTTFGRPGYLRGAMESGADAFLVKDAPAAQLADALRRVLAGERVIDPALAAAALAEGANPHRPRTRGPPRRRRRLHQRRPRHHPPPLPGHRPQLPLDSDPETGGPQQNGSGPHSPGQGLAVTDPLRPTEPPADRGTGTGTRSAPDTLRSLGDGCRIGPARAVARRARCRRLPAGHGAWTAPGRGTVLDAPRGRAVGPVRPGGRCRRARGVRPARRAGAGTARCSPGRGERGAPCGGREPACRRRPDGATGAGSVRPGGVCPRTAGRGHPVQTAGPRLPGRRRPDGATGAGSPGGAGPGGAGGADVGCGGRGASVQQRPCRQGLAADAGGRRRVDRLDDLRVRLQFRRAHRELAALHEKLGAFVTQAGRAGGGAGRGPGPTGRRRCVRGGPPPRRGRCSGCARPHPASPPGPAWTAPADLRWPRRPAAPRPNRSAPGPRRRGRPAPARRPALRGAEAHDEVPGQRHRTPVRPPAGPPRSTPPTAGSAARAAAAAPRAAARTPAAGSRPAGRGSRTARPAGRAAPPPTRAASPAGAAARPPAGPVRSPPRPCPPRRAGRRPPRPPAGTRRTTRAAHSAPPRRTAYAVRRSARAAGDRRAHTRFVPAHDVPSPAGADESGADSSDAGSSGAR